MSNTQVATTVPPSGPMPLTVEQFRMALPDKVKKSVNQELIDQVNKTLSNPDEFENYRNNLLSFSSVMKDGRFKIDEYLNAVRYVSFKLMGATNIEAYTKTFPDKYARFVAQGVAAKDIASYCTAYNKSKLVNLIFEQTLVPVHVLNMDMYQKALNAQFELGMTANSEKVRADALNSVLAQLKPPETKKIELDVGIKEDSSINALRKATMELAEEQRRAIAAGAQTPLEAAHSRVIPADVVDVEAREVK